MLLTETYKGRTMAVDVDDLNTPQDLETIKKTLRERLVWEVDERSKRKAKLDAMKAKMKRRDDAYKKAEEHMEYVLSPEYLSLIRELNLEALVLSKTDLTKLPPLWSGAALDLVHSCRQKLDKQIMNELFAAEDDLLTRDITEPQQVRSAEADDVISDNKETIQ